MSTNFEQMWAIAIAVLGVVFPVTASVHAVLLKKDVRATTAWVAVIWFAPFVGVVLYWLLGINRIKRRAASLGRIPSPKLKFDLPLDFLRESIGKEMHDLQPLALLVGRVVQRPLMPGNRVEVLINGDEAYPEMLNAIASAQRSITLSSYIFDSDPIGKRFVEALAAALNRNIEIRVLVDAVGLRYSWHRPVTRLLQKAGIPAAKFLPTLAPWRMAYANLRNHRKIMVVDGSIGFTGGMNIRQGNYLLDPGKHPIQDVHFCIEGPVVQHLQESFAEDWRFTTGEHLEGVDWFPALTNQGDVLARGISDGPDEDLDKLKWAIHGALNCARYQVQIVTPYFLPDGPLIAALNSAALRGVQVDILLPEHGNLALVQWASKAQLWQILENDCNVWLSPPPFDHTKLLIVDRAWSLVGSANWDPRSLRLNFEFNVECYDQGLAEELTRLVEVKRRMSRKIELSEVDARRLVVRLRDGVARLLSPYL